MGVNEIQFAAISNGNPKTKKVAHKKPASADPSIFAGQTHKTTAAKPVNKTAPKAKALTPAEKKTAETYKKDLASGVLTREKHNFLGIEYGEEYLEFHHDTYKKLTGGELTYGQISARYGVEPGVIRKENKLHFRPYDAQEGKGYDVGNYKKGEIADKHVFSDDTDIPQTANVKKYLNAISK